MPIVPVFDRLKVCSLVAIASSFVVDFIRVKGVLSFQN